MYETDLKVGEIVILRPKDKNRRDRNGFKAFIEEIIVPPTPVEDLDRYGGEKRIHSGVFSLYGFRPNDFFGVPDWYVGDTLADDFERTGEKLTLDDLKRLYLEVGDSDPTFKADIIRIANNLGRESGRNEDSKQEPLLVS